MNKREQKVKSEYEAQGWRILRGGAPDFIALKVNDRGDILEFMGIEVKSDGDTLTYEQAIYKKLFELAKIPYVVEVDRRAFQANPGQTTPGQSTPRQAIPVHTSPNHARPSHTNPNKKEVSDEKGN